ncbi:pentapeptide repeat-containing protein [Streptomyces sp. NBC_01497]|uniref:pentapeptide repeat-containing protein n=1 Tax=Streptomyces sp. NBC_01497 TaxID=2903885 RepID=UPI002E3579E8|nr:pentapeptide repeat-containing protein [Streptomyces sp. NBC_01497]
MTAIVVAGAVFFAGWDLLDAHGLKPEHRIDSKTLFDLVKLSFGVVAGAGALVALVVAYRRQRVDEDGALRDATRLHNERFTTAVSQLGDASPAVQLGGVHALAGLADDAPTRELRQTCIDVLCAYLRLPYTAEAALDPADQNARHAYLAVREVRHTVIRLIRDHLRLSCEHVHSWQGHDLDFTGCHFDGGSFDGAVFSGGRVVFTGARFADGTVTFTDAEFSSGTVGFAAEFSGGTVQFGARFSGGTVDFTHARFTGSTVDFSDARFSGGIIDFTAARFSAGTVTFATAEISGGTLIFTVARFSGGTVDFTHARFSGSTVTFTGAWFSGGTIAFVMADFSRSTVDFTGARFSGSTVRFSQATGSIPPVGLVPPTGQPVPGGLLLPLAWHMHMPTS